MRRITILITSLLMLLSLAPMAEAQKETWDGLGAVLKGAYAGIPLEEFLKNHPDAKNASGLLKNNPVNPKAGTADLVEQFNQDPFLQLWVLASYGFKEGKLRELVVLWHDESAKINAVKDDFLKACVRKHGAEFRRDAMKIDPGTNKERWAPVLVWTTQEAVFLAVYSTEQDEKKGPRGSLTYAMLPIGDPFVEVQLEGKSLSETELKQVYNDIEQILTKAVKKAGKQKKK